MLLEESFLSGLSSQLYFRVMCTIQVHSHRFCPKISMGLSRKLAHDVSQRARELYGLDWDLQITVHEKNSAHLLSSYGS